MKNVKDTVKKVYGNKYPVKVLQIGEGNFLRAFADWMINEMNKAGVFNSSVVICQPIREGRGKNLNEQDCVYTVLMRGIENNKVVENKEIITSVNHCINPFDNYDELMEIARSKDLKVIISNTTEAGIAYHEGDKLTDTPPKSYPAKLAVILYERYKALGNSTDSSLLILPVELIERNGDNLKKCVLKYSKDWNLGEEFTTWLEKNVCFSNTLVDRIVSGYPREEIDSITEKLGYEDNNLDTCEPFHSWVIEAPKEYRNVVPFEKAGLHITWTDDMTPYRTRKVRILNGTHTLSVLAAYLCGHDTVCEMLNDKNFNHIIKSALKNEIIPNIKLPREELDSFAAAVIERFSNPFIKHHLLDISLNSVSKFKARNLDSLLETTEREKKPATILCFGLAALIEFYKGEKKDGKFYGKRAGNVYEIRDGSEVIDFFEDAWKSDDVVKKVLSNTEFWGIDLCNVAGIYDKVKAYVDSMEKNGMASVVEKLAEEV